ncbi:hypothetical protein KUCAC02_005562 [Chaenocephalus aceratus]|uniref:Uncharacterized protein n=1 Tax=Chaenocephalus aceratus TaxID=36190 RepID=A0ACB9WQG3_CHAAC|nr:hypothetical protein KUCAC02_005562 [Chaenocephalus aceratus]
MMEECGKRNIIRTFTAAAGTVRGWRGCNQSLQLHRGIKPNVERDRVERTSVACPRWTHGASCSRECDCVQNIPLAATPKQEAVSVRPPTTDHSVRKNVSQGSSAPAVSSHVTVQVEGHVTRGPGSAVRGVLQVFTEKKCQLACPSLRYAESCRLTCGCGGAPCDPVTGRCICPAGKTGDSCHEDCPDAFWGMKCQSACPDCENGASCNKESGVCECRPGFMGNLCQNECPPGLHGPGCEGLCSCPPDTDCDPQTDTASALAGKRGPDCATACESGYWGPGCVNTCECREISESCDPVSGQCVCEAGFTGDHCEKKCVHGSFGRGCVLPCRCESGALCDHVSEPAPAHLGLLSSNRGVPFLSLLLGLFLQEKVRKTPVL